MWIKSRVSFTEGIPAVSCVADEDSGVVVPGGGVAAGQDRPGRADQARHSAADGGLTEEVLRAPGAAGCGPG